jgi:hypothetical protein
MYDEQLEKLIEMAIVDGELSAKEKLTLFKKAESLGIDLDEFELILDGRLFERQQALKNSQPAPAEPAEPVASAPPIAPKSDKFGDIRKCPACGGIIGAAQAVCGDCGHAFTNVGALSSVTKLHEQLIQIESEERNRPKSSIDGGGFLSSLTNPAARIAAMKEATQDIDNVIMTRKAGIIQSFPVPNSKEDMLDFLTMAVPECKKKPGWFGMKTGAGKLYNAWHSKAEQIVMKAKFSLKEDKKAMEEILYYAKELDIKV